MNKEIWKKINSLEDKYEVSNLGNVKSIYNNRNLTIQHNQTGYCYVVTSVNGKRKNKLVHRLVAEAFLENPKNYPQVNHKDENKRNNNVDNLEWCTAEYNCNHGTFKERLSKSKKTKVKKVSSDGIITIYDSVSDAAKMNNVSITAISKCITGVHKTCKGDKYNYLYAL